MLPVSDDDLVRDMDAAGNFDDVELSFECDIVKVRLVE